MRPIVSAGLAVAMITGLGLAACTDDAADDTIETPPVQQTEPMAPAEPAPPAATEPPPATEEPAPQ